VRYASFVRRFAAFLIDMVVVPIVWAATFLLLAFALGVVAGILGTSDTTDDRVFDALFGPVTVTLLIAVPVLYSALFEAGAGGTAGKLLLKIHVARADGSRLGFSRALLRAIVKLPSALLFGLPFLPAAVSERHQAVHDLISGTVVLSGSRARRGERVLGPPGEQADQPVMVREG
jgi:uncharacterized RDD family membrane protein YckC